jgi:hypothetical protein
MYFDDGEDSPRLVTVARALSPPLPLSVHDGCKLCRSAGRSADGPNSGLRTAGKGAWGGAGLSVAEARFPVQVPSLNSERGGSVGITPR